MRTWKTINQSKLGRSGDILNHNKIKLVMLDPSQHFSLVWKPEKQQLSAESSNSQQDVCVSDLSSVIGLNTLRIRPKCSLLSSSTLHAHPQQDHLEWRGAIKPHHCKNAPLLINYMLDNWRENEKSVTKNPDLQWKCQLHTKTVFWCCNCIWIRQFVISCGLHTVVVQVSESLS